MTEPLECFQKRGIKYIRILKVISTERLNILELSCRVNESYPTTRRRLRRLEGMGFVKKAFAGSSRIVLITEEGRKVIGGVEECTI